jgi:hypothetical protein
MSGPIVGALLTGALTGGVWVGIVLMQRTRRISEREEPRLPPRGA